MIESARPSAIGAAPNVPLICPEVFFEASGFFSGWNKGFAPANRIPLVWEK